MTNWCLIPNLILYGLASLFYLALPFGKSLRLEEGRRFWLADCAKILTLFGALLHFVYLVYLFFFQQFLPLNAVAFGVILLFLWFQWRREGGRGLGSFFLPLSTLLFLFSLGGSQSRMLFENLPWLVSFHIVLAVLTVVFMIGNFVLGTAFWIFEKRLKEKKWEVLSLNLPPLVLNEKWGQVWLRIGFVFLTLVLLTGAGLGLQTPIVFPWEAFHIVLSLSAWTLYIYLLNRHWSGPEGGRIVLLSLAGFVSLGLVFLWN